MGVNVEISGRENSKELLRPESMVKSLAFGQARWADPLKDLEDRTVWLAKWEMSVQTRTPHGSLPAVGRRGRRVQCNRESGGDEFQETAGPRGGFHYLLLRLAQITSRKRMPLVHPSSALIGWAA